MPFLGTTGGGSVKQYGGQANLGYFIKNSLRLRNSVPGYLTRTFGTPTNTTAFTLSFWVKRGSLGSLQQFFLATLGGAGVVQGNIEFQSDDTIHYWGYNGSSSVFDLVTTQVFRDPAAWYHIVAVWDSANATSSSRVRLYVNGTQVSSFSSSTYPSQNASNATIAWNTAVTHYISRASVYPIDCYIAEINFIDGQALTSSSFGKTDAVTGQWIPKKYLSTYGNNGFYLKFADASAATAAALGKDSSPNGNNWTPNNISVTAGATYDAMIDSPTLSAVASNYCVLNPLDKGTSGSLTNGNLNWAYSSAAWNGVRSSFIVPKTGQWYWEAYIGGTFADVGLCLASANLNSSGYNDTGSYSYGSGNAEYRYSSASQGSVATYTSGDTIAYRVNDGVVSVYKNNSLIGTWSQNLSAQSGDYFVAVFANTNSTGVAMNFGQRPFTYTLPAGFKSLNTFNLP